jgi:hypothetical protein
VTSFEGSNPSLSAAGIFCLFLALRSRARDALAARLIAPTPAIAVDAARYRRLNVSLANGFALATAQAHDGHLASFDHRVRRALPRVGLELAPQLRD